MHKSTGGIVRAVMPSNETADVVVFKGDTKTFFDAIRSRMTKAQATLINLADRWQDEKEYEDIKEYQAVLQKALPGMAITRMTKRPFGCLIHIPGHRLPMYFRIHRDRCMWGFER